MVLSQTNTPPHPHHRCWLLNFVLVKLLIVIFIFSGKDAMSLIFKTYSKTWLVTPKDASTLPQSALMNSGLKHSAVLLDAVNVWLVLFLNWHLQYSDDLCFPKWFQSPCCNFPPRIMWVLNSLLPEGLQVTSIQCWFLSLFLICRDFSRFSDSFSITFSLKILQSLAFAHWETLVLNSWT